MENPLLTRRAGVSQLLPNLPNVAPDLFDLPHAVTEASGGSQSFNAVNQLRILGRWMRMITIPNAKPPRRPQSA
jgi:NAD(P)H-dependent FMN reductase